MYFLYVFLAVLVLMNVRTLLWLVGFKSVMPRIFPITVYKKALGPQGEGVIVTLRVPWFTFRNQSWSDQAKCRTTRAKVIRIKTIYEGRAVSTARGYGGFLYTVGAIVKPDNGYCYWPKTCAPGIHFFMREQKARSY